MTADDPATGRPWSLKQLEWRCHELLAERKQRPPLPDECVVPRAALRALCRMVRAAASGVDGESAVANMVEFGEALDAFEVEP